MAWRSVSSCTSSPSGTPIIPSSIDPRLERRLKNPKPPGIQKRVPSSDIACQDDPWPNPKQPKHGYKILVSTAHLRQCQVHACWTHAWVSARLLGPGAAWMKWMKWIKIKPTTCQPKKESDITFIIFDVSCTFPAGGRGFMRSRPARMIWCKPHKLEVDWFQKTS